jgi:hypothetical protein
MPTSKPLIYEFSFIRKYRVLSQNYVKKMFSVKKVTKLSDLMVVGNMRPGCGLANAKSMTVI